MPRGDNPNSRKNLKKPSDFTSKELRERAQKGAKKSAEVRKIHRTFKEIDLEQTTDEDLQEVLKRVVQMMKHGNLNAIKVYMEMTQMNTANTNTDDALAKAKDILGGVESVID